MEFELIKEFEEQYQIVNKEFEEALTMAIETGDELLASKINDLHNAVFEALDNIKYAITREEECLNF